MNHDDEDDREDDGLETDRKEDAEHKPAETSEAPKPAPRWTHDKAARRARTWLENGDIDNLKLRCHNWRGALLCWYFFNRCLFEARSTDNRVQVSILDLAKLMGFKYRHTVDLIEELIAAGLIDKRAITTGDKSRPNDASEYTLKGARKVCTTAQTPGMRHSADRVCTEKRKISADRKKKTLKKGGTAPRPARPATSSEEIDQETGAAPARVRGRQGARPAQHSAGGEEKSPDAPTAGTSTASGPDALQAKVSEYRRLKADFARMSADRSPGWCERLGAWRAGNEARLTELIGWWFRGGGQDEAKARGIAT